MQLETIESADPGKAVQIGLEYAISLVRHAGNSDSNSDTFTYQFFRATAKLQ
jgi:hypothetical protein